MKRPAPYIYIVHCTVYRWTWVNPEQITWSNINEFPRIMAYFPDGRYHHIKTLTKEWKQLAIYSLESVVALPIEEEEADRREDKGHRCCLGNVLDCPTSHLAGRINWRFWKNIHFGRVVDWCGVNRNIVHFSEASIPPSVPSSKY